MAKREVREVRIEGNLAFVPLTQGKEAIVDAADADIVAGVNWCAISCGGRFYAVRGERRGNRTVGVSLHRTLMGSPKGLKVDHINGDGLDNRRGNLRAVTDQQNAMNAATRKDNKTGLKGVCFERGRWGSRIRYQKKLHFLGYFDTPQEAHAAYLTKAKQLFGEFMRDPEQRRS